MSESGSSIVLKRSKQWIDVDLVAGTVQKTAAVVAADVVSVGGDRASVARDIGTRPPCFQDGIPDLERSVDKNAAAVVAVNRAVSDGTAAIDAATGKGSIVVAEGAVSQRYRA
jgi:hypothetical protein